MINNIKDLYKWAESKNLKIVVDDPKTWGIDTGEVTKKKLYAYSYLDTNKNCWIEPTRFFLYINDMHFNIYNEIIKVKGN